MHVGASRGKKIPLLNFLHKNFDKRYNILSILSNLKHSHELTAGDNFAATVLLTNICLATQIIHNDKTRYQILNYINIEQVNFDYFQPLQQFCCVE